MNVDSAFWGAIEPEPDGVRQDQKNWQADEKVYSQSGWN